MSTDTNDPPTVTDVETTDEAPYVTLVERQETARSRALGAGTLALAASISIVLGYASVAALTAAMSGYLVNDWLTWDERYHLNGGDNA